MGLISDAVTIRRGGSPIALPQQQGSLLNTQGTYLQYAQRGYAGNEIVYAAIELLASSAGEPHITGRRKRRNSPTYNELKAKGVQRPNAWLVRNSYVEELPNHPLVTLLNNPNPFMSRGQLWGTVVMDRCLSGNAYLLKARTKVGNAVGELWRLRPDRVKVIPHPTDFIEGYEYDNGKEKVRLAKEDVIHFKTRNPMNDYYGMPPLAVIWPRISIDAYMRSFLSTFFESGGTGPGSILTVKQRVSQEAKDQIRDRFRRQFGGSAGFHEMLILDQAESAYQQLGLNRGLRDALPKEINDVQESRIAMVFGIPGSILGLLIGYESSSYANKRADWQVLWDVTVAPMLSDMDDVLNLCLVPDFAGIDEVYFDLDDIKALQEDVDAVQERTRKNLQVGGISLEEFRDAIGMDPDVDEGTFYVPSNVKVTPIEKMGEEPPPPAPPPQLPAPEPDEAEEMMAEMEQKALAEARCSNCGRLLGRIVTGARFDCPRCKAVTIVVNGVLTTPNE